MIVLVFYIALFVGCFFVVKLVRSRMDAAKDFRSLKTVTFGDESAVVPDRIASVLSVLCLFFIWGAFTNSSLVPLHVPGPYSGDAQFTYSARNAAGDVDDATVFIRVYGRDEEEGDPPEIEPGDGFALNDAGATGAWGSVLVRISRNDPGAEEDGFEVFAVNGEEIAPNVATAVEGGTVTLTPRGSFNYAPSGGLQMQPIWLPAPEAIVTRLVEIWNDGYQNSTLLEHLWASLYRVLGGFFFGALVGIPLGYAMGLSGWFRGWFDPIVEFMRPVPPLALIPLVIIWFGIFETGKIVLLFLAALWIMTIAARAGVAGVNISKIHAAYSLGASKAQILRHVIVPNSLPEIFTGARVAMGVCWGTVVAAELVAATQGAGMMIIAASRFQLTDIVILGIILIGIIGFGIDILMRMAENWLVPWKGKS
ncbi:ABC transporter permease [Gymnodinialimonas sp.]